jgi:hypothetical protein
MANRPNYQDVRWDHGAAEAAVAACVRAAEELEQALLSCAHAALRAQEVWRGARMESFADARQSLELRGRVLAADCRAAAHAITAASQQAREEQARRVYERAEWERAEREREDREREEREENERRERARRQQV